MGTASRGGFLEVDTPQLGKCSSRGEGMKKAFQAEETYMQRPWHVWVGSSSGAEERGNVGRGEKMGEGEEEERARSRIWRSLGHRPKGRGY